MDRDLVEIIEFIDSAEADLFNSPSYTLDPKMFLAVEKLRKVCKMIVENIAYERARNE